MDLTGMSVYRIEPTEERKKDPDPGPVVYAVPHMMEYMVFPNKDIPRLKAYIRSTSNPVEVLKKASKKGFPLYFQLFRRPFTNEKISGILKDSTERTMEDQGIIYCLHYDQRVHPALCISRNLIYPKETAPSEFYLEAKERLKTATTREEKKRLRRELKKHSPILDPYPKCRSCIMARKLTEKSCLGAEFDLEDKECLECPSRKECCQLMRLRIESILEGNKEEVIQDILKAWKRLSQNRKEVKREMAKKKRKAQEVTEEVVEEVEETKSKKKKAQKKDRAESTGSKRKTKAKPGEGDVTSKSKKKKTKSAAGPVKRLLKELQAAKDEGDQVAARKIRAELRSHGYSLRDQANK